MVNVEFLLPAEIYFDSAKDYADFCGGFPLALESSTAGDKRLRITCNDTSLSLSSNGTSAVYDRASVLGIILNDKESVTGITMCTLRIAFKDREEKVGTLPFLTTNAANREVFMRLATEIVGQDLGMPIFRSPEEFERWFRNGQTGDECTS